MTPEIVREIINNNSISIDPLDPRTPEQVAETVVRTGSPRPEAGELERKYVIDTDSLRGMPVRIGGGILGAYE